MPKLILNGSPEGLDFPTPFATKLYTVTLQLKFAEYLLNKHHAAPIFSRSILPNSADLAFAKNVVSVLRDEGAVSVAQTEALNCLARALGYKHYASLLSAAKSRLESSVQRSEKLPGVFFWVYEQLCPADVASDVELASRRLLELFRACIYKPVFRYDFSKDSRFNAGVVTIYPTGILLDSSGGQENFHDVSDLSLLAVDYKVSPAKFMDLSSLNTEFNDEVKDRIKAEIQAAEGDTPYLPALLDEELGVESVMGLPKDVLGEMFVAAFLTFPLEGVVERTREQAAFVRETTVDKRAQCWLESKHLNELFQSNRLMLAFAAPGDFEGLRTSAECRLGEEMRYFISEGLQKADAEQNEAEMQLWKMGLNAPGMFKAHKAQNPG